MIEKLSVAPEVFVYKNPEGKNKSFANFIVRHCLAKNLLMQNKLCVRCSPLLALSLAEACKSAGVKFYAVTGASDAIKVSLLSLGAQVYEMKNGWQAMINKAVAEGAYYFDQFGDVAVVEYYASEAKKAESELGFRPDYFVDFAGSGATLAGFALSLIGTKCVFGKMCNDLKDFDKKIHLKKVESLVDVVKVEKTDVYALQELYSKSPEIGKANIGSFVSLKTAQLLSQKGRVLIYWEN